MRHPNFFLLHSIPLVKKILIIDDEEIAIYIMKRLLFLHSPHHTIFEFHRPVQALDAINSLQPDLVFLDLSMPEMHGLEVLAEMKKRRIEYPVVVLTSSPYSEDKKDALSFPNVIYYATKPMTMELLHPLLDELLLQHQKN